jgi:hypothetical protein
MSNGGPMARDTPVSSSNDVCYIETLTHRAPERDGLGLPQSHGHTRPFLLGAA